MRGAGFNLLAHKAFAEDDGELGSCLGPFARSPFPVLGSVIENKIQQFHRGVIIREVAPGPDSAAQF